VITGHGVLEPCEVVAEIAKVREQFRADELAVAAREAIDDVALRSDESCAGG
jgi:hypothetical protein